MKVEWFPAKGQVSGASLPGFSTPVLSFVMWFVTAGTFYYKRILPDDLLYPWVHPGWTWFVAGFTALAFVALLWIGTRYGRAKNEAAGKDVPPRQRIKNLFVLYELAMLVFSLLVWVVYLNHP